jgi:hypothetical protein
MNEFLYHILPIIHAYNAYYGRICDFYLVVYVILVVCVTPVIYPDSGRRHDSEHIS